MKLPLRAFSEVVSKLNDREGSGFASDKRASTRMTVSAKIDCHLLQGKKVHRTFSVLMRDISLTGAGLLQTVALNQGTEVVMALPYKATPLFVVALVKHCRMLADGIIAAGMEYERMLDDETAKTLATNSEDVLKRLKESVLF